MKGRPNFRVRTSTREWTFTRAEGRGIDVDLGPERSGWNEALADSISSMPPRSSWRRTLSTYWIDRTLGALHAEPTDGVALASGNSTEIVMDGDVVVARSLYDLFDDEQMNRDVFEGLLVAWRAEVVAHRREFRIEKTYRRNGYA